MRDSVALSNPKRSPDRLTILADEFTGGNVANREPVSRRNRCRDAEAAPVRESQLQAGGRLLLYDRNIVFGIDNDRVVADLLSSL